MHHRMQHVFLASILFASFFAFALPTHAAGNSYYVFADDESASDSNSCQLVSDPCLTLAGVIAKVEGNIDPSNATIYARGTFHEQVDISYIDMSGLTMTAYDTDNVPVIDATGYDHGVIFSHSLRDITFSHFEIVGPNQFGLAIAGDGDSHAENINFSDVYIHDFGDTGILQYGIYVVGADHVTLSNITIDGMGSDTSNNITVRGVYANGINYFTLKNSTITHLHASLPAADVSSFGSSLIGVFLDNTNHFTLRHNTLSNFVSSPEINFAGSLYPGIAGVWLSTQNQDGMIRNNTMSDFTINILAHGDGSNGYANMWGISAIDQQKLVIRDNTMENFSSTFNTDLGAGQTDVFAVEVTGLSDLTIAHNTVKNFTSFTNNAFGTSYLYLFNLNTVSRPVIRNNKISNIASESLGGGATTTILRLYNTEDMRTYHNKIADFAASGEGPTGATAIELGYNTYGDVFNNAVYLTEDASADVTYAMHVKSKQTSPLNIVHNTIVGVPTCLYLEDAQDTTFMNNICYTTASSAQPVIVNTANVDMSTIHSDYNSFYNTEGVLSLYDTAVGILNFSDWQSGDYAQDVHSITEDPALRLVDSTPRHYLHLKKTSPLIGMGNSEITMSDATMQKLVKRDWDDERRIGKGHVPDIGFDQYHK